MDTKELEAMEGEEEIETRPVYLVEFFSKLLHSDKFADVYFIVGEGKTQKRFPAHRLVLAASSALFEAMLYPPSFLEDETDAPKVEDPLEVVIEDTDAETFSQLLQCIYTDEVDVNAENIAALIACAKKYQIEKLQIVCAEFMEADINADNALQLFAAAPALLGDETFGIEFIRENAEEVFASDSLDTLSRERLKTLLRDDQLSIEEQSVFAAVKRWGIAQIEEEDGDTKSVDELKIMIADLIPLIRFPAMDVADIAAHVAPSGLLEQGQLLELFKYSSMPEGKLRNSMEMTFLTKPRSGGFSVSDTKLLEPKYRKDVLKMFNSKKSLKFTLLYRGSRDGFTASSFHSKCDSTRGTFTIARNKSNKYLFGGYFAGSWSGSGYSSSSEKSWVYSLRNSTGKTVKLNPSNTSNNCYRNNSYGPTWGAGHDLHINNNMQGSCSCNPNTFKSVDSNFSSPSINNSLLAGSGSFGIDEIEVFAVVQK